MPDHPDTDEYATAMADEDADVAASADREVPTIVLELPTVAGAVNEAIDSLYRMPYLGGTGFAMPTRIDVDALLEVGHDDAVVAKTVAGIATTLERLRSILADHAEREEADRLELLGYRRDVAGLRRLLGTDHLDA